MDAGVGSQFGMKGCGKLCALPCCNDTSFDSGEGLALGAFDLMYVGRADEGHGHVCADVFYAALGGKASQLSPVGVSARLDVHGSDAWRGFSFYVFGQEDESCAGSEDGHSLFYFFSEGVEKA